MGNHVSKELTELGLRPRGVAQAQETASSPQTCSKEPGRGPCGAHSAPSFRRPAGFKGGVGRLGGGPLPSQASLSLARCLWGLETRAGEWGCHKQCPAAPRGCKTSRQRLECGRIQEGFSGGSGLIASLGPWGQRGARPPPLPLPAILLLFPFASPAPPLPRFCSCVHESLPLLVLLSSFL